MESICATSPAKLESVEAKMLALPQSDCPVVHRFGPGVYLREVHIPAGTLVLGHHHRHAHTNVCLKGRLTFLDEDGTTRTVAAPYTCVGKPGRKIALTLEDTIWVNIYATEETDPGKLEDTLFLKSETWLSQEHERRIERFQARQPDREDYLHSIKLLGYTPEEVRAIVENEDDLTLLPPGDYKFTLGDSEIDGRGVFATATIKAGELIGPARIGDHRTVLGRYTNHAKEPNARMEARGTVINLIAIRAINGCAGGRYGEEVTVSYTQAAQETIKNA